MSDYSEISAKLDKLIAEISGLKGLYASQSADSCKHVPNLAGKLNSSVTGYSSRALLQHQRPPTVNRTVHMNFRIDPELNSELSRVAAALGLSKASLIETVIRRYTAKFDALLRKNPHADCIQILEQLDQ